MAYSANTRHAYLLCGIIPLIRSRSNQDIVNQAVLEVSDRMLYDVEKMRRPVPHGALDQRLVGLSGSGNMVLLADALLLFREYPARPESAKPAVRVFKTAMGTLVISGWHYQPFTSDI